MKRRSHADPHARRYPALVLLAACGLVLTACNTVRVPGVILTMVAQPTASISTFTPAPTSEVEDRANPPEQPSATPVLARQQPSPTSPPVSNPTETPIPTATATTKVTYPTKTPEPTPVVKPYIPPSETPTPKVCTKTPSPTSTPKVATATPTATEGSATPTATEAAAEPTATETPTEAAPIACEVTTNASYENEVVELINAARADEGVPPLSVNGQLASAARSHSYDMACEGFFDHRGFESRVASFSAGAENIYAGSGIYDTPSSAVDAWLASPGHRENMLNPNYTLIGVGYKYSPTSVYGGYFTADFARP